MTEWLVRASDLLAEPDPGPTPMLVDGLIVDRSLAAIVGKWKHGKTWGLLELGVSIATGLPAFGVREVANPGPVILILEESGRAALHRRLGALARGRAIDKERLSDLHAAANQRVRLDDPDWQKRLAEAANEFEARAVFLDPIARLRRAGLDENSQREYAVVIEAIRDLRDQTSAAVAWVAHTGYTGDNMRGSSDLESVWESRLGFQARRQHRHRRQRTPRGRTRLTRSRSNSRGTTRPERCGSDRPCFPTEQRCIDYITDNGPSAHRRDRHRHQRSTFRRQAGHGQPRRGSGDGTSTARPTHGRRGTAHHQTIAWGRQWRCGIEARRRSRPATGRRGTDRTLARRAVPPLRGVDGDGTSGFTRIWGAGMTPPATSNPSETRCQRGLPTRCDSRRPTIPAIGGVFQHWRGGVRACSFARHDYPHLGRGG